MKQNTKIIFKLRTIKKKKIFNKRQIIKRLISSIWSCTVIHPIVPRCCSIIVYRLERRPLSKTISDLEHYSLGKQ